MVLLRSNRLNFRKAIALITMLVFYLQMMFLPLGVVFAQQEEEPLAPLPVYQRDPLGYISGLQVEHGVNEFTGDFTYRYPIVTPPGRNGFRPTVVLSYSSSNKNVRSIFGAGWELDIPKIERYSRNGVENLYTQHNFKSPFAGGNGELTSENIDVSGYGTYLPKVWENKVRHEFLLNASESFWQVTDAQGTVYTFGDTVSAREQSEDGNKLHTWFLTQIQDLNDNTINYEYVKSQGAVYLTRITYGSQTNPYEVRFEPYFSGSIEQFDVFPSYARVFPVVEQRDRLDRIEVIDPISSRKRLYDFTYTLQGGYKYSESVIYGQLWFLREIQETGISATGETLSFPPTIFEYASYGHLTSRAISQYPVNEPFYFQGDEHIPLWILGDYDGDGWKDYMADVQRKHGQTSVDYERVFLNRGDGTFIEGVKTPTVNQWWVIERPNGDFDEYEPPSYIDIDGDGQENYCVRNNGRSLYCPGNVETYPVSAGGINHVFQYIDFNGTGRLGAVNLVRRGVEKKGNSLERFDGTHVSGGWGSIISSDYLDEGTLTGDINGDGLDDIVHYLYYTGVGGATVANTQKVLLNNGEGWEEVTTQMSLPVPLLRKKCDSGCHQQELTRLASLIDVNRDGLADLFFQTGAYGEFNALYLNTGKGWEVKENVPNNQWDNGALSFTDLNHDSVLELRYVDYVTDTARVWTSNHILDLPVLTKVTLPQQGTVLITYKPASSYKNPDDSAANRELPIPWLTVFQLRREQGIGGVFGDYVTYSYSGGKLHRPDVSQKEFLGFQNVTKIFSGSSVTSIVESEYLQGEATTNFAEKGLLSTQKTLTPLGQILREAQNFYTVTTRATNSYQALLDHSIEISYSEADPNLSRATASVFNYDAYGNPTQQIDYGEIIVDDHQGNFTDILQDKVTTNIEYAENTTAHILSHPQRQELRDFNNGLIGETKTYYDDLTLGEVLKGNPTKTERLLQAPDVYLTTLVSYNNVGLPLTRTNPRGKISAIVYDVHDLYPVSRTNAANQTTLYPQFDYLFGTPLEVIDPNGLKTVTVLDPLGRVLETRVSDPSNPTQEVTRFFYVYDTTNFPNSVTTRTVFDPQASPADQGEIETVMYYDGLGRLVQTKTEVEGEDQYVIASTFYNNRGNVEQEPLAVFVTGQAYESLVGYQSAASTSYSYDALNRLVSVTTPVGTITTVYDLWQQTITDANGHQKALLFDARGNLVEVQENLGGNTYSTTYTYDALNNLIKITDAQGNIRNMDYDLLGRRILLEDLHAPGDPTFGVWSFEYDENGNMTARTDPKNQRMEYTYDDLDRLLLEDDLATNLVTYEYDDTTSGAYGIGRVFRVVSEDMTKIYTYDILGRVTHEERKGGPVSYNTDFTYDLAGNLKDLTYPDGTQVIYTYNAAGQLQTVDQDAAPVVTNIDYAPMGLISRMDYANSISTVNTYDINQAYRLTNRQTTRADTSANMPLIVAGHHDGGRQVMVQDALGNVIAEFQAFGSPSADGVNVGVGDSDQDGSAEIITTKNTGGAEVVENEYDGTRIIHDGNSHFVGSSNATGLHVSMCDLGGTGRKDKIVLGKNDGGNQVVIYEPGGVQVRSFTAFGVGAGVNVACGDIDGDSVDEIIVGKQSGGNQVILYEADGSQIRSFDSFSVGSGVNVASGDVNGDGVDEIIVGKQSGGREILIYDAMGAQLDVFEGYSVGEGATVATLDVDADGVDEILIGKVSGGNEIILREGNGAFIRYFNSISNAAGINVAGGVFALGNDAATLQDISYTFDSVGNITQIVEAGETGAAKTAVYTYDDLDRLLSATVTNTATGGDYTRSYSYDILGNITDHSEAGVYTYGGSETANPHAVTNVGGVDYTYDANGNLTSNGLWTHTWDTRDRLTSSTDGSQSITYTYDEAGTRVRKKNLTTGTETLYVSDLYEIEDSTVKRYIFAGTLKVATETTGGGTDGLVFHHDDHLTGSNVETDSDGTLLQVLDYYPFGDVRLDEQLGGYENDYKFTGKELDEDTDLYYYEARYYDAKIGRFISIDPWFGEITDPQSLNKYAYTLNNPIKYTDPSGLCPVCVGLAYVTPRAIDLAASLANGSSVPLPAIEIYRTIRNNEMLNDLNAKYGARILIRKGSQALRKILTIETNIHSPRERQIEVEMQNFYAQESNRELNLYGKSLGNEEGANQQLPQESQPQIGTILDRPKFKDSFGSYLPDIKVSPPPSNNSKNSQIGNGDWIGDGDDIDPGLRRRGLERRNRIKERQQRFQQPQFDYNPPGRRINTGIRG